MLPFEAINDFLVQQTNMPFYNVIQFGEWYSSYNDITLKVSHVYTTELPWERPLGWYKHSYLDLSAIDIFIRDNTANTNYPNAVYQLALFIKQAINEQGSLPAEGIAMLTVTSAEDIPIPEQELNEYKDFSIYHLQIMIESKYYK